MRAPAFLQAISRSLPGSKSLIVPPEASAGRQHRVLVLDVDDAELVAMLGIERVGEALGRLHELGIEQHHLARIDVADAVGILHRRDQVGRVGHLGIVELLGHALLVHLVHVVGRQALDVRGAAAQAPSRPSSWRGAAARWPRPSPRPSPWARAAASRCSWRAAANSRRPRCRRRCACCPAHGPEEPRRPRRQPRRRARCDG